MNFSNIPNYDKYDYSAYEELENVEVNYNNSNIGLPNMTVFSGSTGSGKTHLLFLCLLYPEFFDYEELYILTPSKNSKQYTFLKYCFKYHIDKVQILKLFIKSLKGYMLHQIHDWIRTAASELKTEDLQNYTKLVITDKVGDLPIITEIGEEADNGINYPKRLVIADDIINNKLYNNIMEGYFTRGRPLNISCIYLTQKFTKVPLLIRENLSNLFLFKTDETSLRKIYGDVASSFIDKRDFYDVCTRIWTMKNRNNSNPYVFINKIEGIITSDVFNERK